VQANATLILGCEPIAFKCASDTSGFPGTLFSRDQIRGRGRVEPPPPKPTHISGDSPVDLNGNITQKVDWRMKRVLLVLIGKEQPP
jgi:hypothetical protein